MVELLTKNNLDPDLIRPRWTKTAWGLGTRLYRRFICVSEVWHVMNPQLQCSLGKMTLQKNRIDVQKLKKCFILFSLTVILIMKDWSIWPFDILFLAIANNVHGFPVWWFELLIFLVQEFGYNRGDHNVRLLKELVWINEQLS